MWSISHESQGDHWVFFLTPGYYQHPRLYLTLEKKPSESKYVLLIGLKQFFYKALAKRLQHVKATYRNIVGRIWPPCCYMLSVVGPSLKMVKFQPTTVNMSQHGATGWPNACNMLCPTMFMRYVALTCDHLAGA